jgi:hypothetical protein
MDTAKAIKLATNLLTDLHGQTVDVLDLGPPGSTRHARSRFKYISKLSPFLANIIEEQAVEMLNGNPDFKGYGNWIRQDPGFPDVLLDGKKLTPAPGLEIKLWYPLSTEVTARFRDSQDHFASDQTYVVLIAWIPEYVVFGKPTVLEIVSVSARSIAEARDAHYHTPPGYLVVEPRDTRARTKNLKQTNTAGYKWQGTDEAEFEKANKFVASWGKNAAEYSTTPAYQAKVRELMARFDYRLDTNFAKIDRIAHDGIEAFKSRMLSHKVQGLTVKEWLGLFSDRTADPKLEEALRSRLGLFSETDRSGSRRRG